MNNIPEKEQAWIGIFTLANFGYFTSHDKLKLKLFNFNFHLMNFKTNFYLKKQFTGEEKLFTDCRIAYMNNT